MPTSVPLSREEYSRREFEELRLRIYAVRERIVPITPRPGGILEREDYRTESVALSWQVKWQLQLAAEHLMTLDRVVEAHDLPVTSGYPLIRSSIECAGQAHWLLQNEKSSQRVLRALRTAWADHVDRMNLAKSVDGMYDPAADERVREHLLELRRRTKELRSTRVDVKRLNHTDMLTEVERKLKLSAPSPLVTWRLCSALTHGNALIANSTHQLVPIEGGQPNLYRARSSWHLTVPLIRSTLATIDAAIALLQRRAEQAA